MFGMRFNCILFVTAIQFYLINAARIFFRKGISRFFNQFIYYP